MKVNIIKDNQLSGIIMKKTCLAAAALALLTLSVAKEAAATNGYFMTGSGYKVQTAGAGSAVSMDGTDAAVNPALIADLRNEFIISLGIFHPEMRMDTSAAPVGNPATAGWSNGNIKNYLDGSIGYRECINQRWSFGVAVTGSGLGAKYPQPVVNPLFLRTPSDTEVAYRVVMVSPTLAYKSCNDKFSVGGSVILGVSDFKSNTIIAPTDGIPSFPQTVGDNHHDQALGIGARIGTKIHVTDRFDLGLTVATPVWFQRFDKYKDALISSLNYPANGTVGVAYKLTPCTQVFADYKYIYFRGDKLLRKTPQEGGFGWKNQNVFMIGAQHHFNDRLTGRVGYNYGKTPLAKDKVFANVLVPIVVEHHIGAGLTYKIRRCDEISLGGYFVPRKTMTDPGTGDSFSQAGRGTRISMWQYDVQIAWKHKF